MNTIKIAIDGYAGTGKSTTARMVAKKLDYTYIDTGAMYRAVTLYFLDHNIPFEELNEQLIGALADIRLNFKPNENGDLCMFLNGKNVANEIRHPRISAHVSPVAVHGPVREKLVNEQRIMGKEGGIVMDGRDIGTVVFPDAELKIFMTASMDVRAARRQAELEAKGNIMSLEAIRDNLAERDHIDANRAIAPLKKAADAVVIDTSEMTFEDQVSLVCKMVENKLKQLSS
ncbi:MAG: (d)CMP kinase [Bacteroidia bacterium]|nr:(d)CMP kinase [Bacteroidia bacterium]